MAASKLLSLIALTTLALLTSSFGPTPVNAISTRNQHLNRHVVQHDAIAKRKRSTGKRCKQRPSSSLAVSVGVGAGAAATSKASSASPAPTSKATAKASSTPKATTKASSTPKASPTPADTSSPSTGKGGGKVGLAWPNGNEASLKNFATENVIAMYTWSPYCPSNTYGIDCWPMLWGDKQIGDFTKVVTGGPVNGGNFILGPNEPNQGGQANISPQRGCDIWHQYIQPKASKGFKLITPATSSAPNGLTWVKDFMKCCTDCSISGVGVHWYGTSASEFKKYLTLWHDTFGLPIYVTEYAVQDFTGGPQSSKDQIFAFHREVGPWMNSQSWVAVHMPFGFMRDMQGVNDANRLMNDNGTPTDLGRMIINNAY
ncbi:hypothetical protein NLI96_g10796 [Meripilus lineatus]|uniref:Asl1-like glycosyl hydrolase catalytic domain-containing protein n=1 Tax=Meripilus lineatus TaxID=2056292 RepID=A0AAD5USX7_9APHY|nr:hypothetical protein NLI96_g10796 [Physisporinus lineatus]